MQAIPAIIMVASAAVSAYGSYQQGKRAKEAADANAALERQNAEAARRKAEYDAERSALEWKQLMGRQKALYAKAGVDITSGSPLLTLAFESEQAEKDRQAILYSGRTAEASANARASLYEKTGNDAYKSSYIAAGGTFLSGVAKAYDTSYFGSSSSSSSSSSSGSASSAQIYQSKYWS